MKVVEFGLEFREASKPIVVMFELRWFQGWVPLCSKDLK